MNFGDVRSDISCLVGWGNNFLVLKRESYEQVSGDYITLTIQLSTFMLMFFGLV